LTLAILVGRDLPGRVIFRTIFFLPYVLSEVIAALMWLFILNPDPERGFINAVIELLGGDSQAWLGNTDLVLLAIFAALTWKYFGYHMLLFMTGVQNIPSRSKKQGASMAPTPSKISLYHPALLGSTIRTVYLSVLGSIQQFILV
jgi:raffinose/stachyose/melibiose transport system permease protein